MKERVEMWTDGACSGNPGPGGWGVVMKFRGREKEISGGARETTNNRMELTAAIRGLASLVDHYEICVWTDSTYVRDGITRWLSVWRLNGWKTSQRKPVKNADLWKVLEAEAKRHTVEWRWVRGHTGVEENERADALAREALESFRS